MKRIDVYITEKQDSAIKEKAKDIGISFSEMLRRLIDESLFEAKNKSEE
jgi:predicted DNA binding CopG/RHH family protein